MKWLIFTGVLVHLVFLASIFDIYFKSPVVTGVTPQNDLSGAPAVRLVLIVLDGLRADSFFSLNKDGKYPAPYLRSVLNTRGSWGVSHTRVPTESRPGHVALIAGLYEDPSAVARGWQENPVHFDSLFNRSRETWSWGSPDILPMFARGAVPGRVHTNYYSSEEEDFSGGKNASLLDTWVFEQVETFFSEAVHNNLTGRLKNDKIVFFLHLLGMDTSGHTHKPHSDEYAINLQVVDDGVKKVENIIEDFYNHDGKTVFIVTSDHGMTDWGSHGSGDPHETETPFIAWGAGIKSPNGISLTKDSSLRVHSPVEWGVNDMLRKDLLQGDVSPLMATLIGTAVPMNSVGTLPIDYLNTTEEYLACAILGNALQMAAQLLRQKELTETGMFPALHRPYTSLSTSKIAQMEHDAKHYIDTGLYKESIKLSNELLTLSIVGLEYYHTYHQVPLLLSVTLSYLGWIAWMLTGLLLDSAKSNLRSTKYENRTLNILFSLLLVAVVMLIYVQSLPEMMYIYYILPIVLWWSVLREAKKLKHVFVNYYRTSIVAVLGQCIGYLVAAEILVLAFFFRYVLSVAMICLAIWGAFKMLRNSSSMLKTQWIVSCILLAVFPATPVVGNEGNFIVLLTGSFLWVILGLYNFHKSRNTITCLQLTMLLLSLWNIYSTRNSFDDKSGLPWLNMIVSWIILVVSPALSVLSSVQVPERLWSITVGLAAPFILLSVGHEPWFLLALASHMYSWLKLEHKTSGNRRQLSDTTFGEQSGLVIFRERQLNGSDFRRAYFFLFYVILCFFGTGNIASLSSFDPQWVRCFVATFSPFLMGTLIISKTLVPFLLVTCFSRAVNVVVNAPTGKLFLAVLVFSDLMGLHFLFLVRNKGSWLDIGTTISHYVIMQSIVLLLLLLYGLAKALTCSKFNQKAKIK